MSIFALFVRLVPTSWADGDSFLVRFPDGAEHTVRLYGADCFEWHVTDKTDARRLSAQRRYFGITRYGGTPTSSIDLAKSLGEAAATAVRSLLAKPFTIHTGFADGGGDGNFRVLHSGDIGFSGEFGFSREYRTPATACVHAMFDANIDNVTLIRKGWHQVVGVSYRLVSISVTSSVARSRLEKRGHTPRGQSPGPGLTLHISEHKGALKHHGSDLPF